MTQSRDLEEIYRFTDNVYYGFELRRKYYPSESKHALLSHYGWICVKSNVNNLCFSTIFPRSNNVATFLKRKFYIMPNSSVKKQQCLLVIAIGLNGLDLHLWATYILIDTYISVLLYLLLFSDRIYFYSYVFPSLNFHLTYQPIKVVEIFQNLVL